MSGSGDIIIKRERKENERMNKKDLREAKGEDGYFSPNRGRVAG